VGKVYNDQWMMERGFLDVKTFKDIVSGRGSQKLITVKDVHTEAEAIELMKKYDIQHIPVMNDAGEPIGAISESGLFNHILGHPDIRKQRVADVLEASYPVVTFDTPVERLSHYITKDNGAVLGKDDSGAWHIVTKYDIIQHLSR
jgi:cystathionine beta-synthase